jgi:hypothetical protein
VVVKGTGKALYFDNAVFTSFVNSRVFGVSDVGPPDRLFSHCGNTVSETKEKAPLARLKRSTAKLRLSSLDFLSASRIARSCSYAPNELTMVRA